MNRARYRPKARRDIDEISEHIAVDNLDAAIHFCLAVEEAVEKLSLFPGMGQKLGGENFRLQDLRSWPIKGFRHYLIFYLVVSDSIEIVRILHGARDIAAILAE